MEQQSKGELMTRKEAQRLLKISGVTLSKYTKTRRLTFYRIGKRVLFDRDIILNEIRKDRTI